MGEASIHGFSASPHTLGGSRLQTHPHPVPPRGRMRSPSPRMEFVPITANLPVAATSSQRSTNMTNQSPVATPRVNSLLLNDHSSVTVPVRGRQQLRAPSLSAVPAMLTPPSPQSQTALQQHVGTSPPPSSDRLVYPAEIATTCRTSGTSPFSMSVPVPPPVRRVSEKASQHQDRLASSEMSSNRSMSPASVGRGRSSGKPRAASPGFVTTSEAKLPGSRQQSPSPSLTSSTVNMESETHSAMLGSHISSHIASVRNQWASRCTSTQKTLSLSRPVRSSGPTDEELLRHVRRCVAFQEESSACGHSSTGTTSIASARTRTGQ